MDKKEYIEQNGFEAVYSFGVVRSLVRDEDGVLTGLLVDTERLGECIMHTGPETVWVDAGARTLCQPEEVREGQRVCVAHSTVVTCSLPPRSPAFAVICRLGEGTACPHLYRAEGFERNGDGSLSLVVSGDAEAAGASQPRKSLLLGGETRSVCREGMDPDTLSANCRLVVWTDPAGQRAEHLLLL